MHLKSKMVEDPIQSTFNDLKLFEQDSYCYRYIKKHNPDILEEDLVHHARISAAAFRQASEYYNAATKVSISTSPLLYSYAMNNLLKGVCYLKSFDQEILDGFNSHGFKVDKKFLNDDALNSKVTLMKRKGAVQSLLKLYGSSLESQDICLYKLLRHIPNIDSFYYESVGSIAFVGMETKNSSKEYIFNGSNINNETKNILKGFALMLNSIPHQEICSGYLTGTTRKFISEKFYDEKNLFYKKYLNIPEEYFEGLKDINISFYCYLLMMSYGMIVRYNPHIWEAYIDKKNSSYSTLIELSIPNSVLNFYFQMHYLLFEFYYEHDDYDELDIKRIIKDSTIDIMNNITKKIKDNNFRHRCDDYLPWRENIR